MTLVDAPDDSADVEVFYNLTRFTDAEIIEFLTDAAMAVGGDLGVQWDVQGSIIDSMPLKVCNADKVTLQTRVQTGIVYRAAVDIYGDKANQAADKAILVKDGDTTIDTSKTSTSSEKAMERIQARYNTHLRYLRSVLQQGTTDAGDDQDFFTQLGPQIY